MKFIHCAGESTLTIRIAVTCIFWIILAALIVLEERENEIVRQYFLVLSYAPARGGIYLCMVVLVLSNSLVIWLDILIVIFLILIAGFNFFITFKFKDEERARTEEIAQAVE